MSSAFSLFAFRKIVVNKRNGGTKIIKTKYIFEGLFTALGANPIEALKLFQRKVFAALLELLFLPTN